MDEDSGNRRLKDRAREKLTGGRFGKCHRISGRLGSDLRDIQFSLSAEQMRESARGKC